MEKFFKTVNDFYCGQRQNSNKLLLIRINYYVMTTLVIDNKSYVVVPTKSYQTLQKKAALKTMPEKTFTIEEARAHSKKLIRKWATAK